MLPTTAGAGAWLGASSRHSRSRQLGTSCEVADRVASKPVNSGPIRSTGGPPNPRHFRALLTRPPCRRLAHSPEARGTRSGRGRNQGTRGESQPFGRSVANPPSVFRGLTLRYPSDWGQSRRTARSPSRRRTHRQFACGGRAGDGRRGGLQGKPVTSSGRAPGEDHVALLLCLYRPGPMPQDLAEEPNRGIHMNEIGAVEEMPKPARGSSGLQRRSFGAGLHDVVDDQILHPSAEPPRKGREGTQQPGMKHLTLPTEAMCFHHEGAPHGR